MFLYMIKMDRFSEHLLWPYQIMPTSDRIFLNVNSDKIGMVSTAKPKLLEFLTGCQLLLISTQDYSHLFTSRLMVHSLTW